MCGRYEGLRARFDYFMSGCVSDGAAELREADFGRKNPFARPSRRNERFGEVGVLTAVRVQLRSVRIYSAVVVERFVHHREQCTR